MEKKRIKHLPNKTGHSRTTTVAEEAAVAYGLPNTLRFVNGTRGESNYVKRALALMGVASSAPFNAVENIADFIRCIRAGVPKKALDNLVEVTGIGNPGFPDHPAVARRRWLTCLRLVQIPFWNFGDAVPLIAAASIGPTRCWVPNTTQGPLAPPIAAT